MSDNRTLMFTTLTEDTHRPDKVGLGVWDVMIGGRQPVCRLHALWMSPQVIHDPPSRCIAPTAGLVV